MSKKLSILFVASFLLVSIFSSFGPASTASASNCQAFSETGFSVCGKFLTYWQSHGGLAQQGFPISGVFEEQNAAPPAGDGKIHRVQYFQRARFEEHLENAAPYDVLLGLLGTEQFKAKYPSAPNISTTGDTCQTFAETGFSVCGRFLEYWLANGGLTQQGFPISSVFDEQNAPPPAGDSKIHRVQYFQRARFEEHNENARPYDVLLGLLGAEQYQAKYATNPPTFIDDPFPGASPTPAPTQPPSSGGSVTAVGCLPAITGTKTQVQTCVSDPDPAAGAVVTVYGRLIVNGNVAAGASMNTTWHYKTTTPGCSATADSDGVAECSRDTGRPTRGYTVRIDVTISYNGQSYSASTSFTPH